MHSSSPERGDFISILSQYDVDVDDVVSRVVFWTPSVLSGVVAAAVGDVVVVAVVLIVVPAAEACSFCDRRH
jgi:hypothetical protein